MKESLLRILKLAKESEDYREKNAYIQSAILLIEEKDSFSTNISEAFKRNDTLKEFRLHKKKHGLHAWYTGVDSELEAAKEWKLLI